MGMFVIISWYPRTYSETNLVVWCLCIVFASFASCDRNHLTSSDHLVIFSKHFKTRMTQQWLSSKEVEKCNFRRFWIDAAGNQPDELSKEWHSKTHGCSPPHPHSPPSTNTTKMQNTKTGGHLSTTNEMHKTSVYVKKLAQRIFNHNLYWFEHVFHLKRTFFFRVKIKNQITWKNKTKMWTKPTRLGARQAATMAFRHCASCHGTDLSSKAVTIRFFWAFSMEFFNTATEHTVFHFFFSINIIYIFFFRKKS